MLVDNALGRQVALFKEGAYKYAKVKNCVSFASWRDERGSLSVVSNNVIKMMLEVSKL